LEWLQTLIATVVGAGLAAGVGEINRRSARKDEWIKTRRTKLEEVFAALADGEAQAVRLAIAMVQRQQGLEADPVEPLDMTRLAALVSLYVPEAAGVLAAHRARLDAMRGPRMQRISEAAKKLDAKAIQGESVLMAMEMNAEIGQFARELRPLLENLSAELSH
jgi:hypothetical protein